MPVNHPGDPQSLRPTGSDRGASFRLQHRASDASCGERGTHLTTSEHAYRADCGKSEAVSPALAQKETK